MMPFPKCPICGGELIEKQVTKLLRGGINIASISVPAEVCLNCGERLYSHATVRQFAAIRNKLERGETEEFYPMGQSLDNLLKLFNIHQK
jgi:YgiT-type zinc finger domain-containing protein